MGGGGQTQHISHIHEFHRTRKQRVQVEPPPAASIKRLTMSLSVQFSSLHPAACFVAGQMQSPIVVNHVPIASFAPQGHKMKPLDHDINLNSGG